MKESELRPLTEDELNAVIGAGDKEFGIALAIMGLVTVATASPLLGAAAGDAYAYAWYKGLV